MSDYKYPYIPKKYYAATMFACKMIRENGYFNKAIRIASNYYDVDADELEKHVRARQAGKKTSVGRKYHWYVVQLVEEWHNHASIATEVCHATNELNAIKQALEKSRYDEYESRDYGYYVEALAVTDTKDDAIELARKLRNDEVNPRDYYPYQTSNSPKAVHAHVS